MANRLHISDSSSISVDNLVLTDMAGTGNCVVSAPSGQSYQMLGSRMGYQNVTVSTAIDINESNTVWTNTGASAITFTLPSGAPNGVTQTFVRTGAAVTISPSAAGKIWHTASGIFRALGTTVVLASSGAKLAVVADGGSGWYPMLEEGTIT